LFKVPPSWKSEILHVICTTIHNVFKLVYMLGDFHKNRNNSTVFEEFEVSIVDLTVTNIRFTGSVSHRQSNCYDRLVYYLNDGWGHQLSLIDLVLYMTPSVSWRLNILFIIFKIMQLFMITICSVIYRQSNCICDRQIHNWHL
jgi:hypothetical protein